MMSDKARKENCTLLSRVLVDFSATVCHPLSFIRDPSSLIPDPSSSILTP
jgi:hypothetical protein